MLVPAMATDTQDKVEMVTTANIQDKDEKPTGEVSTEWVPRSPANLSSVNFSSVSLPSVKLSKAASPQLTFPQLSLLTQPLLSLLSLTYLPTLVLATANDTQDEVEMDTSANTQNKDEKPIGEVSTGEVSTREVSTGEVPTGEVSTGEILTGDVMSAEAPTGEVPTWRGPLPALVLATASDTRDNVKMATTPNTQDKDEKPTGEVSTEEVPRSPATLSSVRFSSFSLPSVKPSKAASPQLTSPQ